MATPDSKEFLSRESQKDLWDLYSVKETAEGKGYARGMEQGLERGEKKKAIEIARKMKSRDVSPHDISQFTGLSLDEIANL